SLTGALLVSGPGSRSEPAPSRPRVAIGYAQGCERAGACGWRVAEAAVAHPPGDGMGPSGRRPRAAGARCVAIAVIARAGRVPVLRAAAGHRERGARWPAA